MQLDSNIYNCMVVLGPTASGKTRLAAQLAYRMNGAVFSVDSRQIYKKLTVGTGKDLSEYVVNDKPVPYFLIDLVEPGSRYHLWNYLQDFANAWNNLQHSGLTPILCGGTGLYLEAVIHGYQYAGVPVNESLRKELDGLDEKSLLGRFNELKSSFDEVADTSTRKRLTRAIEIGEFLKSDSAPVVNLPTLNPVYIGLDLPLEERRKRISSRLKSRFQNGLLEEVDGLLKSGLDPSELIRLGLEYKFITEHLQGLYSFDELFHLLETAIHQYAKRQMTWFRKMERDGNKIHWISALSDWEEQASQVLSLLSENPGYRIIPR